MRYHYDIGKGIQKAKTKTLVAITIVGLIFGGGGLALAGFGTANAIQNTVTPSTNDINRTNGWAHVDQVSEGVGTTNLQFISTRNFYSCFEYRTDGNTSQILTENSGVNYNTLVTDGLYPYVCENNSNQTLTIHANSYVEVRMVFGAETDERFDWTPFNVLPNPTKDTCKDSGWMNFSDSLGFKNQGQCVSYVEHHNGVGQDDSHAH